MLKIKSLLSFATCLTISVNCLAQSKIWSDVDLIHSQEGTADPFIIDQKYDSLLQVAKGDSSSQDSVIVHKRIGDWNKHNKNFKAAIAHYHQMPTTYFSTQDTQWTQEISHGYSQMAQAYLRIAQNDSALWATQQSIQWSLPLELSKALAINYHRMAIIYKNMGQPDSNEFYLKKGLAIAAQAKDSVGIGNYEMTLGVMYLDQRKYYEAIKYFKSALEIGRAIDDKYIQVRTLDKLAIYYNALGDTEKEKYYINQQLALAKQVEEIRAYGAAAANAANFHSRTQNYDSAFFYIDQSIAYHNQAKEIGKTLIEMNKKARMLYETHRYSEAQMLYTDVLEKSNDKYISPSTQAYIGLAKLYNHKQEYEKAIATAQKAYHLHAKEKMPPTLVLQLENCLYQSYKGKKDFEQATEHLENVLASTQKSKAEKSKLAIARIEYEYQLKEKQKAFANEKIEQNLLHQQELNKEKSTRNNLIIGAFFITILLVYSFFAQKRKKKDNLLLENQAEELTQKNLELEKLHMSRNTLLKENIDEKERRISAITMSQYENQLILTKIEEKVEELIQGTQKVTIKELNAIKALIKSYLGNENSWDSFVHQFEQVNPNFFTQLKERYPLITVNDLKTCAYLKIGMDNKSIAQVTNASPNTVKSRIHRLKKKMNIAPEDSIRDLIISL